MIRGGTRARRPSEPDSLTVRDGAGSLTDQDFDDLVRASWQRLVRLAVLLLGDRSAAEDIVQDAFASLYRTWRQMTSVRGADAYVRTSVVNGSRSVLRHRRVTNAADARLDSSNEQAADSPVLLAESRREVVAALAALPRRQREVIVLRYWAELSEAEIANMLRISRGSVKSASSRGIAKMAIALGGIR